MAREKKREVGTSLRGLLKDARIEAPPEDAPAPKAPPKKKPARKVAPPPDDGRPSEVLVGDDRVAFQDAMMGVRPLRAKTAAKRSPARSAVAEAARARGSGADEEARARLGALVASQIRFRIEREGELVLGWRAGTPARGARDLQRKGVVPEATVDLHGLTGEEAERALVKLLRAHHRRGVRRVCVVHGKGLHSEGGVGVLGDVVVRAMTEGGAAPVVLAFATAPRELGGSGALLVQLMRR
ncbi:MAG: Smr/MutS family protein [Sandaracinaceae bacterium]